MISPTNLFPFLSKTIAIQCIPYIHSTTMQQALLQISLYVSAAPVEYNIL